jgi:hypothetical protein
VSRLPLSCQPGVYLVDCADGTVKVGRTRALRSRLREHARAGATHARAWALGHEHTKNAIKEAHVLSSLECAALGTLTAVGEQVRATERVRGVPFTHAAELVDTALHRRFPDTVTTHRGGTVDELLNPVTRTELERIARHLGVPLTDLTEEPKP